LTDPENLGALNWLKKNDDVEMPSATKRVVEALADLRQSTPSRIEQLVYDYLTRMAKGAPLLEAVCRSLASGGSLLRQCAIFYPHLSEIF